MKEGTLSRTASAFKGLYQQHLWETAFWDMVEARTEHITREAEYAEAAAKFSLALEGLPRAVALELEENHSAMVCHAIYSAFLSGLFTGIQGASPYGLGLPPKGAIA